MRAQKMNLSVAAAAVTLLSLAPFALAGEARDIETVDAKAYVGSEAAGVTGSLEINGSNQTIPAVDLSKGTGPAAYKVTHVVKSYSNSVNLPDGTTLAISSGPSFTTASSKGQQGSTLVTTAGTTITMAAADVKNAVLGDLINLSATSIRSNAQFTTKASTAAGVATTAIDGLVIKLGPLLVPGGYTIPTYTGTPSANEVLYMSTDGSLIIYLNRQTKNLKTITAADVATPTSIEVDAVDVHLNNASVFGQSVSGDVRVGVSYAN